MPAASQQREDVFDQSLRIGLLFTMVGDNSKVVLHQRTLDDYDDVKGACRENIVNMHLPLLCEHPKSVDRFNVYKIILSGNKANKDPNTMIRCT